MASNQYRLSVRRGPEEGQTFPLTSNSVTVGRDPMAEIVFSDPEVSRQHARFTRKDGGYELQDLGSTNGTFVDGRRLGGEVVSLQPGAVITMGSNVTVVYEAASDPMATVISPDMGLDFAEEDEAPGQSDDPMRTMMEAPAAEEDAFPGFDDFAGDDDGESTSMEPATGGARVYSADEGEGDPFSFDFDEAEYGEPVEAPGAFAADDRTVLDMESSDLPDYRSQARDDDSLPSFDDSSELPSFDDEPAYKPPRAAESPRAATPPPPPPPAPPKKEADPNRRRNMIIAVVILLLLCCCCSIALTYFYLGDILLAYFQV